MSFTATGVRKRNLDTDRLQSLVNSDEQGFIQRMKPFNAESAARGLVDSGQSEGQQPNDSADIFTTLGKGINGAIGYVQNTIEVAAGDVIDFLLADDTNPFASYFKIVNAGVGKVIDVFNGGDFPGQILKLQGDDTDTVTLDNANDPGNTTSNIIFPGTAATVTLAVDQMMEFIYDPLKTINGFTGAWRFTGTDVVASSGTLPAGTAVNDHLEWNGSSPWVAQQFFEFGTTGPFADSGFLKFPNDQIMLSQRNVLDDGNLELKVTSNDIFDFTESNEGPILLQIRSQHASDPDNVLSFNYGSGATADPIISWTSGSDLLLAPGGNTRYILEDDRFTKRNEINTEPIISTWREDSTPTATDIVGHFTTYGEDSADARSAYFDMQGVIGSTASGGTGNFIFQLLTVGTLQDVLSMGNDSNLVIANRGGTEFGTLSLEAAGGEIGTISKLNDQMKFTSADDYVFEVPAAAEVIRFAAGGVELSTTLDMNGENLVTDVDGDSNFGFSVDDEVTLLLGAAQTFVWGPDTSLWKFDINSASIEFFNIPDPSVPATSNAKIWFDDDDTLKIIHSAASGKGVVSLEASGGETFVWTALHDTDGFNFKIDEDGDSEWVNSRALATDDWTQLLMAGSIALSIRNDGGSNVWVRVGFDLEPNSSSVDLGSAGQPWRAAYIDDFMEFDGFAGPIPASTQGTIFWNNTTKSFHQRDDTGLDTDLSSASAGANQQLSNLSGTVAINLDLLPSPSNSLTLGDSATPAYWANVFTDRLTFEPTTIQILEVAATDLQYNVPTLGEHIFRIATSPQLTISATTLDVHSNFIANAADLTWFDANQDIGASGTATRKIFLGILDFDQTASFNNSVMQLGRKSLSPDALFINVPTGLDFVVTEQGSTTLEIFFADTSADLLTIGPGVLATRFRGSATPTDFTITHPASSGSPTIFNNAGNLYRFDDTDFQILNGDLTITAGDVTITAGNLDMVNNNIDNCEKIQIETGATDLAGEILGVDATPDIFHIKLAPTVDFLLSDDGTTAYEFINTTALHKWQGNAMENFTTEFRMADRTSNPSTPASGLATLFVFDDGSGNQTLRIRFDNGTTKDIVDDT